VTLNLDRLTKEVRPTDGVFALSAAVVRPEQLLGKIVLLYGSDEPQTREALTLLVPVVGYGTVVVLTEVSDPDAIDRIASGADFRPWLCGPDFPGLPAGTRTWVKSHYDGSTYGTHLPYLLEAVRRTTGPVLELGAGDGSTPVLHELCSMSGRLVVTVDCSMEWLVRYASLMNEQHRFEHKLDPSETEWLTKDWAVVFVDHSPGETRRAAIARARERAEYIVVHDTEELGYEIEELLSSFKHRKDFRYARPWTSVVSDRREVW